VIAISILTIHGLLLFLMQVAYGRFSSSIKGYRNMDLFVQQTDGKKILDPKLLDNLCSRLKEEMLHPLRVIITNRGPDTELLVANPVELCGKGRPRVFYDVTLALKKLGICIFSVRVQYLHLAYIFHNVLSSFSSLLICRLKSEGTQLRIASGKSTDSSWLKMVNFH
jgi:hypothetical protein